MKNLLTVVLLAATITTSQSVMAQKSAKEKDNMERMEKEKAQKASSDQVYYLKGQPVNKTRGINPRAAFIAPVERIIAPEIISASRGKAKCIVNLQNSTAAEVDVYFDTVYAYSVPAKGKVQMTPPGNEYRVIHMWSVKGDRSWYRWGNCASVKNIVLQ